MRPATEIASQSFAGRDARHLSQMRRSIEHRARYTSVHLDVSCIKTPIYERIATGRSQCVVERAGDDAWHSRQSKRVRDRASATRHQKWCVAVVPDRVMS